MAFPTSPSNNDVHKEGNRAFVWDSTLGTWDQIKETKGTESEVGGGALGNISSGTLSSNVTFPPGHVIQTTQRKNNYNFSTTSSTVIPTPIYHKIHTTAGNYVLFECNFTFRYRPINQSYAGGGLRLYYSTDDGATDAYSSVSGQIADLNSTNPFIFYAYWDISGTMSGDNYLDVPVNLKFLHDGKYTQHALTGTSHYYKIYMHCDNGTIYILGGSSIQFITLQEIQA